MGEGSSNQEAEGRSLSSAGTLSVMKIWGSVGAISGAPVEADYTALWPSRGAVTAVG
jgi:hypothetical protein